MTIVRKGCAGAVVLVALLGGCAHSPGRDGAEGRSALASPVSEATLSGGKGARVQIAALALDDRTLATVRGGFDVAPGLVVSFGFEQATYLNHNLVQKIVIPTITVTPRFHDAATARVAVDNPAPAPTGPISDAVPTPAAAADQGTSISVNGTPLQTGAPASTVRTTANAGLTSLVSSLNSNGLTNLIQNRADGQLIQQVTAMNIGVSGLSQLLVPSAVASAASRLAVVNTFMH